MKLIKVLPVAGTFADNKDVAKDLRLKQVLPALANNEEVTLDFEGVEGATQSFVHALISDAIRQYGNEVLDHIIFKNCNLTIEKIVTIVVDYMQES